MSNKLKQLKPIKIKASISISAVQSSKKPHRYVSISVSDETSFIRFATADISYEQLGLILAGQPHEIDMTIRNLELLGKTQEHQKLVVLFPTKKDNQTLTKRNVRKVLKPYEVDGWIAHDEDVKNHHNHVKTTDEGTSMKISFHRFIDKKES
jgi:hypothetical protein